MKQIILSTAFAVGTLFAQGQQMPNPGFENWDNLGTNEEEPTNYNSTKTGGGFANLSPQNAFHTDIAGEYYSGTAGVKLETTSTFGKTVNGILTNGKVQAPGTSLFTIDPFDAYNETVTADTDFSDAFTDAPDSIVFFAKYLPQGGAFARVQATLHTDYDQRSPFTNDPNGTTNVDAEAVLNFGATSGWERISVPFDYSVGNASSHTHLLLTFTSTAEVDAPGTKVGSVLFIDDVEMMYNPTIAVASTSTSNVTVTASNGAPMTVDVSATIDNVAIGNSNTYTVEMSDNTGSFASPTIIGSISSSAAYETIPVTIPAGTAIGNYDLRVVANDPLTLTSTNTMNITVNDGVTSGINQLANNVYAFSNENGININSNLQEASLTIYNVSGQLLAEKTFNNNIQVSLAYKGLVIVKILSKEGSVYTAKFNL